MRWVGLFVAACLWLAPRASAVTMDWVTVGDAGNACDSQPVTGGDALQAGCFGGVDYTYRIGAYEVTNSQYAEFLNAVAQTDTHDLYSSSMANASLTTQNIAFVGHGGISRSGSSGSYVYAPISGRENKPVNYVSFYDSLRFANWMHNGQPSGAQGSSTTEDGAYTLTAGGIAANSIVRNPGALVFLTSEDEWYKAAYYDAGSSSYLEYPFPSNSSPTCSAPGSSPDTANCDFAVFDPTDVGTYVNSPSSYGTFDQAANLYEFNEAIMGSHRGLRGGDYASVTAPTSAPYRNYFDPLIEPWDEISTRGFRVASAIPEPNTALLLGIGLVGVAMKRRTRREN